MEATPSGAGPAPTAVATAAATVKAASAAAGPLNAAALGPPRDLLAARRTAL